LRVRCRKLRRPARRSQSGVAALLSLLALVAGIGWLVVGGVVHLATALSHHRQPAGLRHGRLVRGVAARDDPRSRADRHDRGPGRADRGLVREGGSVTRVPRREAQDALPAAQAVRCYRARRSRNSAGWRPACRPPRPTQPISNSSPPPARLGSPLTGDAGPGWCQELPRALGRTCPGAEGCIDVAQRLDLLGGESPPAADGQNHCAVVAPAVSTGLRTGS
jgi:hypothetical protein